MPRSAQLRLILLLMVCIVLGGIVVRRDQSAAEGSGRSAQSRSAPISSRTPDGGAGAPGAIAADDFCNDVGYLCAGLAEDDRVVLRRWSGHDGTLVVHVPMPEHEEPAVARALQRAAAQGIRAWNNQPFPILTDLRGDRGPHFMVQWTSTLAGMQIGLTRTSWSQQTGLSVLALELATRQPGASQVPADPRQVRLTAAHEMGHALGLPHSDQPRDVMYATNTATAMSAQDYRSIEILYATPDGTIVTR